VTDHRQGNGAAVGCGRSDSRKPHRLVKDVIEESNARPVLIGLLAEWCGPCKQLTPAEKGSGRQGQGQVVQENIDQLGDPGPAGNPVDRVIAFRSTGQPPTA